MFDRIRSEIAYFNGLRRALARTTPVGKNPTRTFCDLADELAAQLRRSRRAAQRSRDVLPIANGTAAPTATRAGRESQGLAKGDVVCLLMPNRPEYLAIWLGLARAGLITALINTNVSGASLAHSVNIAAAKALIVDASLTAAIGKRARPAQSAPADPAHGAPPGETPEASRESTRSSKTFSDAPLDADERVALTIDDGALYVYTSGTTGLPKAARITHSRLLRMIHGFSAAMNATLRGPHVSMPADVSFDRRRSGDRRGAVGRRLLLIRERFSASEFWGDIVRQRMHVVRLCRRIVPLSAQRSARPKRQGPSHPALLRQRPAA